MTAFQFPGLGTRTMNPQPGVYINNGQFWSNIGFFLPITVAAENLANDRDYWPYDRIVLAPRIGRDFTDGFGAFCYQRDRIFQNGTAGWVEVHQCVSQENLLDFGVHTGLYKMFGKDGRAYVAGMYPGAGAGEVGGVSYQLESGVWQSQVSQVGVKFTGCTWPLSHRGRLWLATEGNVYRFDPVDMTTDVIPGPTDLAIDKRDKMISMGGRIFLCGRQSGTNRQYLWEYIGGWVGRGALIPGTGGLAAYSSGAGGEWGYIQDYAAVYVIWYSGSRTVMRGTIYHSVAQIQLDDTEFLGPITFTDRSPETSPIYAGAGTPQNDAVVYCAQEADAAPASSTGNTIYANFGDDLISGAAPFALVKDSYRWAGTNAPWSNLSGNSAAQVSYTSNVWGLQDGILFNTDKIVVYKIERDDAAAPGAVRIYYWAFQSTPGLQSVRIYMKDYSDTGPFGRRGTKIPLQVGTPIATSSGTINVGQKRVDDVPTLLAGSDQFITWDRVADFGEEVDGDVYLNLLMIAAILMPPI